MANQPHVENAITAGIRTQLRRLHDHLANETTSRRSFSVWMPERVYRPRGRGDRITAPWRGRPFEVDALRAFTEAAAAIR